MIIISLYLKMEKGMGYKKYKKRIFMNKNELLFYNAYEEFSEKMSIVKKAMGY